MNYEKYRNIQRKFDQLFGGSPTLVRSPGRINMIGEHTDYNQGFVLPAAIDKEIIFCISTNRSRTCNLYSLDLQQQHSFDLENPERASLNWANYLIGVVVQLQQRGHNVPGFDCVFGGDIPLGAGLSSSAALECGLAFGLGKIGDLELSSIEIARLSQAAENQFVGMQCGLMDQYANMFGEKDHLILMDCRSETHRTVPVDLRDYGLWLLNSNVKHELSNSEYNIRRQETERGVNLIREKYPEVKSLRDCNKSMLTEISDDTIYRRCEYVIEENIRVVKGSEDLQSGRLDAFGEKMYLSHDGLSKKYEVSCPELDLLVGFTTKEDSVLGARMMGGGFGGCTINLIRKNVADILISEISEHYQIETGKDLEVYPVNIASGTSLSTMENSPLTRP